MTNEVPALPAASSDARAARAPDGSSASAGAPPDVLVVSTSQSLRASTLLGSTPGAKASGDAQAPALPSTDDALQAAGDVAAAQRRFFDLRRALKSAVQVLTKERSFLPSSPAADDAREPAQEKAAPAADRLAPARPIGLSGHTSTVAMPEVLGFLAQLRKSGTLWIWNNVDHYRVQLVDGNVTFARSESRRQGSLLGEILISQGAVDAARFAEFMQRERPVGPLGDALIDAGLVTKQALCSAVQHQAQCVFDRAFGLE